MKEFREVKYKKFTIENFVCEWHFNGKSWKSKSWIIHSPYVLEHSGIHLPLHCENEYGEELKDFKTLQQAKDYIDNYLAPKKVEIRIKHLDEITAVVKEEFRKERDD